VEWVGVDPAFRQRGLAFWLMVKQFHYHLRAGRKHVMLWTGPGNHAARKLYYRLGFSDGPHTLLYSLPILPV
jgi:ribosomal protein S18 acetylase RimI-like enzyme